MSDPTNLNSEQPILEKSDPVKKINLLNDLTAPDHPASLELVRLGVDDTAIILFTGEGVEVKLHWNDEVDIRGFALCAGADCLFCKAGRHPDDKVLLPVVLPAEHRIGILQFTTSLRPGSLRSQLTPHLRNANAGNRAVLFLRRDGKVFQVTAGPLKPEDFDGALLVKQFVDGVEAGTIDLQRAVQTLSADQIWAVPKIRQLLILKGFFPS